MKILKALVIVLVVYVGVVVAFESLLGYFQPAGESTLVITTTDPQGQQRERVLSRLESGGAVYVAANHWPRDWYENALAHPHVEVTYDGRTAQYLAVPATESEHQRVNAEHPPSLVFKILTGFAPRYFLRLDPKAGA